MCVIFFHLFPEIFGLAPAFISAPENCRDSSVSKTADYELAELGYIAGMENNFWPLGYMQNYSAPTHIIQWLMEGSSPEVKRSEREVHHSSPSMQFNNA
jgi:hypothetical protein